MSNDENNRDNDKILDEFLRNEGARENAPIVENTAAIWKNPTTLWTEFEIVDLENTETKNTEAGNDTKELESNVLRLGFRRGMVSPDGRMIHLTLSD